MPKKGYKVITIRETLFKILSDIAEKLNKSIPETLKIIVDDFQQKGGSD